AARPRWPAWPPKGLAAERAEQFEATDEEDWAAELSPTPAELALIEAYRAAQNEVRGKRSRRRHKVPTFKFCSNDGWLVTPDECLAVAKGVRLAVAACRDEVLACGEDWDPDQLILLVLRWGAYNELAADHGGYQVW